MASIGEIKTLAEDGIARLQASPMDGFAAIDYVLLFARSIAEPKVPVLVQVIATGSYDDIWTLLGELNSDNDTEDAAPDLADAPACFYRLVTDISDGMGRAQEVPFLNRTAGPYISDESRISTQTAVDNGPGPCNRFVCTA